MNTHPSALILGEDYPLWLIRVFIDNNGHDEQLVRKVLASFSLSFQEKNRVFTTPLSRFQVDELHKVFDEEREEFSALLKKEGKIVFRLNADAVLTAFLLGLFHGARFTPMFEKACIRRMVKKACRRNAHACLSDMPEDFWETSSTYLIWRYAMPQNHVSWIKNDQEVECDVIPERI